MVIVVAIIPLEEADSRMMTNAPLTYFVSLLLFLFCSFTKFLKEGRVCVPWDILSSKYLWRTDWGSTQYPKVLDVPKVVFPHSLLIRSLGQQSRRFYLQSCGAAVWQSSQEVTLSKLTEDIAAYSQCDSVSFLKLHFHQWESHNIRPQFFPKMSMDHKVNCCTFCLLCLKETVHFPSIGKCRIILFGHTVGIAFIYQPTLYYLSFKLLQLNWHNDCILHLVCSVN